MQDKNGREVEDVQRPKEMPLAIGLKLIAVH
jgi:hypothetical protein